MLVDVFWGVFFPLIFRYVLNIRYLVTKHVGVTVSILRMRFLSMIPIIVHFSMGPVVGVGIQLKLGRHCAIVGSF